MVEYVMGKRVVPSLGRGVPLAALPEAHQKRKLYGVSAADACDILRLETRTKRERVPEADTPLAQRIAAMFAPRSLASEVGR